MENIFRKGEKKIKGTQKCLFHQINIFGEKQCHGVQFPKLKKAFKKLFKKVKNKKQNNLIFYLMCTYQLRLCNHNLIVLYMVTGE